MPSRPPSRCTRADCPHTQPCPDHKPSHRTRTNPRSKVYDTKRWKLLRLRVLLEEPTCRQPECHALSTDVDHIVSIQAGGAPYDRANLQALCHPHHSAKTAVEVGLGQR